MEKEKVYTMPELLKARNNIVAAYGLDIVSAGRLVGYYNGGGPERRLDIIAAMIDGDLSAVPAAAAALHISLGVNAPDKDRRPVRGKKSAGSVEKIPEKKRTTKSAGGSFSKPKDKLGKRKTKDHGPIEKIEGDIIPAGAVGDGLPDGFADTVEGWLADWAAKYNVELEKCSGLQWRAVCIYVGENIKRSGVLHDRDREKKEGGTIYHAGRLEGLLALWEYFTNTYKHVPLVTDFIAFAGVSRNWFYDYDGRGLTAARVQLAKKAKQIEEAGISAGLVDGRENPTGRIYYSKARLGWQETTTIQHVSVAASPAAPVLPVFDGSGGFLEDKSVENSTN